jgi:hypothetical protein
MTNPGTLPKDPWRPLSRTLTAVLALLAAIALLTIGSPLLQGHLSLDWSYFGFGPAHSAPCMTTHMQSYNVDSIQVAGLKAGDDILLQSVYVCDNHAGGTERMALSLMALAARVFQIGGLFLMLRLLRGEARRGTFSDETVGRLRFLGWFLVVGELLLAADGAVTHRLFIDSVAVNVSVASIRGWLDLWHPSYLVVLVGVGLVAFARVVKVGAAMREDVEATV